VAQQHQQQLAQQQQQQSALGMPQTTGTPISMQQQLKKLPSALNVPQLRISSNGNLRPLATPVLTAPLTSPQSSPTPTATNGQTSPTPIPSLDGSEESRASSTPAPQRDSATPSAEATPAGVTAASPMPLKPTQPHPAISIPNGYMQNNYVPTMPNGTTTYLHPSAQPNGLTVQQIPLKGAFANGQAEMPIAVNVSSRPAYNIGHVVSNGTNFNLPVGAVGVNVGTNLTNVNLKLPPSRTMPWPTAQRSSQAVAIAQSLSPHMHAHSPTPQVSPPRGGQTPTASPSLHQQQLVNGTGATY
jgi:enhancer of polycomb-like protein